MKITRCKYADHPSIKATVSYHLEGWDLHINDVNVINGKDGLFVSMPSRKYTAKDGSTKYANYLFFGDKHREKILAEMVRVYEEYEQQNPPESKTVFQTANNSGESYVPF